MLKRFFAAIRDRWRNRRRRHIDAAALDGARNEGQESIDTQIASQWKDSGFGGL